MQTYASTIEKKHKKVSMTAEKFNKNVVTTERYLKMSLEKIKALDNPQIYNKTKQVGAADYLNLIYKMIRDGYKLEVIYWYIMAKGFLGTKTQLEKSIDYIAKNNFGVVFGRFRDTYVYSKGTIIITRNELLKEITAKNKRYKHNDIIINNMNLIIEKYPIVKDVIDVYDSFHLTIMGDDTSKLDDFVNKYGTKKDDDGNEIKSIISTFADGIKKDITPAKNAISYPESSGFVEGNNCKFKLIKRIVYGRSKLVNLFKKSFLCFSFKRENFNLKNIINIGIKNATISSDI
jgi:hypothetical protein